MHTWADPSAVQSDREVCSLLAGIVGVALSLLSAAGKRRPDWDEIMLLSVHDHGSREDSGKGRTGFIETAGGLILS
jgi:hypothetical protein